MRSHFLIKRALTSSVLFIYRFWSNWYLMPSAYCIYTVGRPGVCVAK